MRDFHIKLLHKGSLLFLLIGWNVILYSPLYSQDCKALCEAIQIADLTTMEKVLSSTSADCEFAFKYTPKQKNPYLRTKSFSTKRIQSPVHFIAQADLDYAKMLQVLKRYGVDLNKKDNTGQTLLHLAAEIKNEELLALLLTEKMDFNAVDQKGGTVLSLMIDGDTDVELVKDFIRKGVNVAQSKDQNSALYEAFKHNRLDIAKVLLENGASIHEKNKQGTTCLDAAIENQHLELIALAFKNGADASKANIRNLVDEKLIKLLIDKGASARGVDLNNIIAYTQNTELAKWLLERGADPNQAGFLGQTPMYHAIRQNDLEVIQALIQAKADVHHEIEKGENYLTIATYNKSTFNQEIIQLLLKKGVAEWGLYKALEQAIVQENLDKVEQLMACGMDISKARISSISNTTLAQQLLDKGANIKNFDLESIVKTGNVQMIEFLFIKGMNIEARNAVYLAVKHQQIPVLSYLLKNGYNPNLLYQDGKWRYSPLMKAIQNKDLVAIKMLVEADANTQAVNDRGESIIQMAVLCGNERILDYFLGKGVNFSKKTNLETIVLVKTCIEFNLTDILEKLVYHGLDLQNVSLADFLEDDNIEILKVLIQQNVDVNTPNSQGETPLYVAFNKRYYKTIHFLLENDADIDGICLARYMEQQPRFDTKLIEFLVEGGIDIDKKCDRHSPLEVAIIKNDLEMLKYLIEQGATFNSKKIYKFAKKENAAQPILSFLKQNKQNNT